MDLGDYFKQMQPKLLSSEDKEHTNRPKRKRPHKLDNAGLQCKCTLTQADIKPIALMCDGTSLAKITTKPRFDNAKCKFYNEPIPKAVKMKRIPNVKTTRRQRKFEKMPHKRGLVVNFEHMA